MNWRAILLLFPIITLPVGFLLFAYLNIIMPINPFLPKLIFYIFLPLFQFSILGVLILKFKLFLSPKVFIITLLIGLVFLLGFMKWLSYFFVPSVEVMPSTSQSGLLLNTRILLKNSVSLGFLYLSFVTSWFISQYVSKFFFKLLIFIGLGICVSLLFLYVTNLIF